jgi:hypothetical protein
MRFQKSKSLTNIIEESAILKSSLYKKLREDSQRLEVAIRVRDLFRSNPIYLAILSYLKSNQKVSLSELKHYFNYSDLKKGISDLRTFGIIKIE